MRFILFLMILVFYSCKQEKPLVQLPGQTRVVFKEKDEHLERSATALGYFYGGSYEIQFNTLATWGTFYTAIVTVNPDNTAKDLVCYEFFNMLHLRPWTSSDSTLRSNRTLEFDLIFNPGISKYLNQDNCYFSLGGLYHPINSEILKTCTPGKIGWIHTTPFPKSGEIFKSDEYPIKLLGRDFQIPILNKEGKKTYKKGRLELGFLTYDHKKEPDFDALFNSRNFIVNINAAWALANGRNGYPTGTRFNKEELKISNFYTK